MREFGRDVVKEKKRQTQIHEPRHQAAAVFVVPTATRRLETDERDGKENKNRFGRMQNRFEHFPQPLKTTKTFALKQYFCTLARTETSEFCLRFNI